jgi:hypothetical protein
MVPGGSPPGRTLGSKLRLDTAGGSTVTVALADDEPSDAVMVTGVGELTNPAVYWNPQPATPAPPN